MPQLLWKMVSFPKKLNVCLPMDLATLETVIHLPNRNGKVFPYRACTIKCIVALFVTAEKWGPTKSLLTG